MAVAVGSGKRRERDQQDPKELLISGFMVRVHGGSPSYGQARNAGEHGASILAPDQLHEEAVN